MMKLGKRVISAILLLAMIVTMIPATPITKAATEVSYVLDTDGVIDIGATYLIVRVSWTGAISALVGNGTPQEAMTTGLKIQNDQVLYVEGIEKCEWTVETYAGDAVNKYSLLHKNANRYLKIDANGLAHSDTPAPLSISQSGTEYNVRYVVSNNQFYGLYGSAQSFTSYSNSGNTLRFYKKVGGETPKYAASVTTRRDNANTALDAILGVSAQLYIRLGNTGDYIALTEAQTGVYSAEVTDNGTYGVYIKQPGGTYDDTGKTVTIQNADGTAQLDYYSVTYDLNGGTLNGAATSYVYSAGTKVTALTQAPVKDGYQFLGWGLDGNTINPGDMVTENLNKATVLTARWEEIPKYQVTVTTKLNDQKTDIDAIIADTQLYIRLDSGDGTYRPLMKTETGEYADVVEQTGIYVVYIKQPDGTYQNTGKTVEIRDTGNAVELGYYSVTYDLNGGTLNGVDTSYVHPANSQLSVLTETPVRTDNLFLGWKDQAGNVYQPGAALGGPLSTKMELTAQWEEVIIAEATYTVRYLVKDTYETLHANVTYGGVSQGTVYAADHIKEFEGYTYAGAVVNGVYIEKGHNPHMVLQADAARNVIVLLYAPDPKLHLDKVATLEDNGTYTIEMDMFTHFSAINTIVEQNTPLDIVLVLDQSGSIEKGGLTQDRDAAVKNFIQLVADHGRTHETDHRIAVVGYGSGGTVVYNPSNAGIIAGCYDSTKGETIYPVLKNNGYYDYFDPRPSTYVNTGIFDSNGEFHAYPIKGFTYEEYTGAIEKTGTYYTYSHGEYLLLTYHEKYRHLITEDDAYAQLLNGEKIYGYVDGEFLRLRRNENGMWVVDATTQLYSSTEFFTWHNDVWTHRHGIEGREIHAYGTGNDFAPIDGHNAIYTRTEALEDVDTSIYRDALIPVTMGAQGSGYVDPSFDKIIDALGSNGQTRVSYGMEMAYEVLKANPLTQEDKDSGRRRIVIVFTDGKPGDSVSFNEAETNAALAIAKNIKSENEDNGGMNAKIFAIGLYGDETTDAGADVERTKQDQKDFLNALSSNYYDAGSLDELWSSCNYVYARQGTLLPIPSDVIHVDGPYYVKVGDQYYPLQIKYPLEIDTVDGVTYQRSNWCYTDENGQEVICFAYLIKPGTSAPAVGSNGVIVGENGQSITVYRRIGETYNQADSDAYFKTTENISGLEQDFATILQQLTTKLSEEVTVTNDAILRDIMGQGLVLTPGSVITVYSEEGIFISGEKRVEWSGNRVKLDSLTIPENASGVLESEKGIEVEGYDEPIPYISVYNIDAENPTDPNGDNYHPHTVDIVGYDYGSEKWFLNADSPEGQRLIVTITRVEARDNVIWNRAQGTNHSQSGLWQRKKDETERRLLKAFVQPTTVFVERAYVLDYGKAFELSGWYFDSEGDKQAQPVHMDFDLTDGMNYFDQPVTENTAENNIKYGNVKIVDGITTYQPTTTQWGGYDRFYVFGDTWRNTVVTQNANRNGNLWSRVTVIPANSIYYEDSFGIPENPETNAGTNAVSGFVFSGDWEIVNAGNAGQNTEKPEHMENKPYGDVHGWTDSLADNTQYSDGSAHAAFPEGFEDGKTATVTFSFTGTGVDVYTRTTNASGMVAAVLTGKTAEGEFVIKSVIMDNLSVSGDYYQVPTISFTVPYGTYQVTLGATMVNNVAVEGQRYQYYLDGIRVYNPLGTVSQDSDSTIRDAYGKELNAVFTEIRDIAIANNDFTPDLNNESVTGAVFIDWLQEGQESGNDTSGVGTGTYEVATTFKTYGPKNEVYLAQNQAVVIKVDPGNTYYVGMKVLNLSELITAAKVNVSGLALEKFKTIDVGHSTDLYYEVTPMDGYIVIENVSENGALLALTKLRTTNMTQNITTSGVQAIQAQEAVRTMNLFAERLQAAQAAPAPEVPLTSGKTPEELQLEMNKQLVNQLFNAVQAWLEEREGGAT